MTDYNFATKQSEKVNLAIGINGGFEKPTGYSFLRAQNILAKMAKNLSLGLDPIKDLPHQKERFKKYDATLLKVLASKKYTGEQVFTVFSKRMEHKGFLNFLMKKLPWQKNLRLCLRHQFSILERPLCRRY